MGLTKPARLLHQEYADPHADRLNEQENNSQRKLSLFHCGCRKTSGHKIALILTCWSTCYGNHKLRKTGPCI